MTHGKNRFAMMGIAAVALVVASMAAPLTSKAQSAAASGRHLTEAQVLDLQKKFQDATVAADTVALGKLMADDAIFIHGSAMVQTKAEFFESLTKGQLKITTYESKDSKVTLFDGGAIVSAVQDVALAPRSAGAQPFRVQMRVSSVWVAKPAGWQLILNQGTPIPAPLAVRPAAESTAPSR